MSTTRVAATALALASGLALATPAAYLATLSVAAALPPRTVPPRGRPATRIAMMVPAHDEELLVGRCLDTLLAQDYPSELLRVIVIADNCADATAAVAASRGAEVLQRTDPANRGKGHALNWAMGLLRESDPGIGAFVVVDADSVAEPGLLSALVGEAEAGASVVQADYGALVTATDDRALLRAAAFLLFHRVRFSGKARIGLPCSLVGNGMLFTRSLIEEHPWSAFSEVEDLEYTIQLRIAGTGPTFARAARLAAPVAASGVAADVQRRRWEGGRARIVKRHLPILVRKAVRQGRPELWDAAADLAVPPLGVLAAGIAVGGGAVLTLRAVGAVPSAALTPWALASTALTVHVIVGLRAADAPPEMVAALRSAPVLVATEAINRIRVLRGLRHTSEWVRTPRTDRSLEAVSGAAARKEVS